MRRTKIVCTIGPKTCDFRMIKALAEAGMNVVRLNMSHGDHVWHIQVIKAVKRLNEKYGFSIAIMLDTKGPEIRSGDITKDILLNKTDRFVFTTRRQAEYEQNCVNVNYDGFSKDVAKGDIILVDSGLLSFKVIDIDNKDIICECIDGGTLTSRRHLNIQGKSASLPTITKKDWEDIKFGIKNGIDFISLSFVKNSKAVNELKLFLSQNNYTVGVIPKIESSEAIKHLEAIVKSSDGIMIARGDLGAELPVEEIPLIQEKIIYLCRKYCKPVIVATHLLESMIVNPTPTRAEVSDIAIAVKDKADSTMLSGETAVGKHPTKSVQIMDSVIRRIESNILTHPDEYFETSEDTDKEVARSASLLSSNLKVKGILVFTRRGYMAALLSQARPVSPIYAFTNTSHVRRKLNLYWGVTSFRIDFSKEPEKTIQRALVLLKKNRFLKKKQQIIVVSDILAGKEFIQTIQIREVK